MITDAEYLASLGFAGRKAEARELLSHLLEQTVYRDTDLPAELRAALELIETEGPLARRLLDSVGDQPSRDAIIAVYRELCGCLATDRSFHAVR